MCDILNPVISDLPRELPSRRRQQLPKETGKINMGLVDEDDTAIMEICSSRCTSTEV